MEWWRDGWNGMVIVARRRADQPRKGVSLLKSSPLNTNPLSRPDPCSWVSADLWQLYSLFRPKLTHAGCWAFNMLKAPYRRQQKPCWCHWFDRQEIGLPIISIHCQYSIYSSTLAKQSYDLSLLGHRNLTVWKTRASGDWNWLVGEQGQNHKSVKWWRWKGEMPAQYSYLPIHWTRAGGYFERWI